MKQRNLIIKQLVCLLLVFALCLPCTTLPAMADVPDNVTSTAPHKYLSDLSLAKKAKGTTENIYSYNPKTGKLSAFSFNAATTEYTVAFPELGNAATISSYTPTTTATLDGNYENDSNLTLTGAWSVSANPSTTPDLGQTMTAYSGGKATIKATSFRSFFGTTSSSVASEPLKLYYLTGKSEQSSTSIKFSDTDVYIFNFYRILALAAAPTVKDEDGTIIKTDGAANAMLMDPYKTEYNITVPKSTKSLSVTATPVTPASTDVKFDNGSGVYAAAEDSGAYKLTLADYGEQYKQADGSLVIPFTLACKEDCKGGVDGHYTLKVNFEASGQITAETTTSVKASELKNWTPTYSAKDKDGKDATEKVTLKYYQSDGTTGLADMEAVTAYIGDAKTNNTFVVLLSLQDAEDVRMTVTVSPEPEYAMHKYLSDLSLARATNDKTSIYSYNPKTRELDSFKFDAKTTEYTVAFPEIALYNLTMMYTPTTNATLDSAYTSEGASQLTGAWALSANPTKTLELNGTNTQYSGGKATIKATSFRSFFGTTSSSVASEPLKLYYLTGKSEQSSTSIKFSDTDIYTFNFYRILALASAPTVKDENGEAFTINPKNASNPYATEFSITIPRSTKSLSVTATPVTPASTDVKFEDGKGGYTAAEDSGAYKLTLADYGEKYKQEDGSLVIPFTLACKEDCKGGVDGHYTLKVNFEASGQITAETTTSVKASELKDWTPTYSAKDKDGNDATEQVTLKYYQSDGTTGLADFEAVKEYIGDAKTNNAFVVLLSLQNAEDVRMTVKVLPASDPEKENDYIENIKLSTSDGYEIFDMSKAVSDEKGRYCIDVAYGGTLYGKYSMPLTLTDSAKNGAGNLRISATLTNEDGEVIRSSHAEESGQPFYASQNYITDLTTFNYYGNTYPGGIMKFYDFFDGLELGTYNFTVKVFNKENIKLYDKRTIKLTLVPYLSNLSVFDGERQIKTSPDISNPFDNKTQNIVRYTREYNVTVPAGINEITLMGAATGWRTLDTKPMGYICYDGEQKVAVGVTGFPHRDNTYSWFDDDGFKVDLSKCQKQGDKYVVPFSMVWGDSTSAMRSDYKLYVTVGEASDWKISTQPKGGTYDKGASVKLSVSVTGEAKDKVSYQWQWAADSLNDNAYKDIEGATQSTFEPPTKVGGKRSYRCVVTDNGNVKQKSEPAEVKVNLGKVNDPEIVIQPGTYSNLDVLSDTSAYQREYIEGQTILPPQIAAGSTEVTDYANKRGDVLIEFVWYENSKDSYEGAKVIDAANYTLGSNSRSKDVDNVGNKVRGLISSCNITEKLPVGMHYYFCEVTAVATDDDTNRSATIRSGILPITILPRGKIEGFEGTGTESNPYWIKTVEHLKKIKTLVEGGDSLNGAIFKLANDITLPVEWQPIGKNNGGAGKYLLAFSGTIDGGNHKMTISKGGKPLLNYARDAVVKNLKIYGEDINGAGLLDKACVDYGTDGVYQQFTDPDIITVENVTLLSKSRTRGSGLVNGGYSSGINDIIIRNCTIEKDVIVGVDKSQSAIGSFVGTLNGRIEDSVSYATVYGNREVGGLAGKKGQSMGDCTIINSEFLGSIEATGGCVGGILGAGYISTSAPNTPPVSVRNCYVAADITGNSKEFLSGGDNLGSGVGGIIGSEYGIRDAWNDAYISDNHFYGTIHDTSDTDTYAHVGGIIGELGAYGKHQFYTNNYYLANEHYKGLGSMVKTAADWDSEKAFAAKSEKEFADGTVLNLLNKGVLKNWIQRKEGTDADSPYPIHSKVAYVREIKISGEYTIKYSVGEALNLTGAKFTAYWSNGDVTYPSIKEVTITGYNKNLRGVQTITVTYGVAKTTFDVTVLYKSSEVKKISVYFTLLGDTKHGDLTEATGTHTLKDNNLQEWVKKTRVNIDNNKTVYDVMKIVLNANHITWKESNKRGTVYIESLTRNGVTIGEFDNGTLSGWMYTLNGHHPNLGVAQQFLDGEEDIIFHYTDDYTVEEGSEHWNIPGGGTVEEVKDVTTDAKAGTTTAPTDVKISEKTNADGIKTKVADVKVSADNQKEILKQAKEKKSNEIILVVSSKSVGDATKADVTLDKSFIDSIVKDTDAKLTIRTPFGNKTYTQEELKAMSEAATGQTISVAIEKAAEPIDDNAGKVEKAKALTKDLKLVARSAKTAKKNVKVTLKMSSKAAASIKELKNLGYTVKYRYYRSTKKASAYKSAVTKSTKTYLNTAGRKGKMYYYKAQVRVYDENGKLIAKTALGQCKYASRTWSR